MALAQRIRNDAAQMNAPTLKSDPFLLINNLTTNDQTKIKAAKVEYRSQLKPRAYFPRRNIKKGEASIIRFGNVNSR